MVNSTGIMGQLNNGSPSIGNAVTTSPVSSNHGAGANPYTTGMQLPKQPGPMRTMVPPGADTLLNLADLMGNNPGFPGFGGPQLPDHNIPGYLPPPQAVGGGMQPSTPGFDTDAFSNSILSGVGDLFQEYMGPQQPETMPGALPIGSINGGINIGLPDPNDNMFRREGGPAQLTPDELQQQKQLDIYRGPQQLIQPEFYDFNQNLNLGPTTGTANTQPGLLEDDGMNTNYNNASGIQSAFRGF